LIAGLFGRDGGHPLADAAELKRVVGQLPVDPPVKAVDEIAGWFESLAAAFDAGEFRADRLYEAVGQLDQAAQLPLRKLTRDYLSASRLGRPDAGHLWAHGRFYCEQAAGLYERIARAAGQPDKPAAALKPELPIIGCRLLAAHTATLKWACFRHEQPPARIWSRIGKGYLEAVSGGYATRSVAPYAATAGASSVEQEFLHAVVLAASSLASLRAIEVELAQRLLRHLLSCFRMSATDIPGALVFIDAAADAPPQRLARAPAASTSVRLVAADGVAAAAADLARQVERGEVPATLDLGGQYPPRLVLRALRHLITYWSATPPMRLHRRHPVRTQLTVLRGFADTLAALAGDGVPEKVDRWSADNVSLGGFGAVAERLAEGIAVGALVCVCAEGGENWLPGLIRRLSRNAGGQVSAGIQTLAKRIEIARFVPRSSGAYAGEAAFRGIALTDGEIGEEIRVLLPATSFDLRENLDVTLGGRKRLLLPAECLESGDDYDLARYRVRNVD
jgi:hypothetical protein